MCWWCSPWMRSVCAPAPSASSPLLDSFLLLLLGGSSAQDCPTSFLLSLSLSQVALVFICLWVDAHKHFECKSIAVASTVISFADCLSQACSVSIPTSPLYLHWPGSSCFHQMSQGRDLGRVINLSRCVSMS